MTKFKKKWEVKPVTHEVLALPQQTRLTSSLWRQMQDSFSKEVCTEEENRLGNFNTVRQWDLPKRQNEN